MDINNDESIIIPIYYYEDNNGYKILDTEAMHSELNIQLKFLYASTKKGKKELAIKRFKKLNYEKNKKNTNRFLRKISGIWNYWTKTKDSL